MNKVEIQLLNELTDFISGKYAGLVKNYDIQNQYGEITLKVCFDTKKFKEEDKEELPAPKVSKDFSELVESTKGLTFDEIEEILDKPSEKEQDTTNSEVLKKIIEDAPKLKVEDLVETEIKEPEIDDPKNEKCKEDNVVVAIKPADKVETLYKGDIISSDEASAIQSYLQNEFTRSEAAELLGIDSIEFDKLVNRYKRAKNIKSSKASKPTAVIKKEEPAKKKEVFNTSKLPAHGTNARFDYSTIDFDKMYNDVVKHGDSVRAVAKDYGCSQTTLQYKFTEYCKLNNLEYHPIHIGGRVAKKDQPVEEKKEVVKENKSKNKQPLEISNKMKESIDAFMKHQELIGEKINLPNGWNKLEDGQYHLVKDGVVIR